MAKKPARKKAASKKTGPVKPGTASARTRSRPHEGPIRRLAEEIESRFFEGAELATETSSAETNVALAALAAIEGPRDTNRKAAEAKAANGKRKTTRRKTR